MGPHPVPIPDPIPPPQSSVHCLALQVHSAPAPQANISGLRIDPSGLSLPPLAAPDELTPPEAAPIGEPLAVSEAAPLLDPLLVSSALAPVVLASARLEESAPLFASSPATLVSPVGNTEPESMGDATRGAVDPPGTTGIPETATDPMASNGGAPPPSATENATSEHAQRFARIVHTHAQRSQARTGTAPRTLMNQIRPSPISSNDKTTAFRCLRGAMLGAGNDKAAALQFGSTARNADEVATLVLVQPRATYTPRMSSREAADRAAKDSHLPEVGPWQPQRRVRTPRCARATRPRLQAHDRCHRDSHLVISHVPIDLRRDPTYAAAAILIACDWVGYG